jgi:hypothetical protein
MSNTGSNRRRDSKRDENLIWLERIAKKAKEKGRKIKEGRASIAGSLERRLKKRL